MVKWFKKIVLLLAGFLMLVHGILPHHHHEVDIHQCANKKGSTYLSNQPIISESCSCSLDHSSDADPACFGIGTSLVKAPNGLDAALTPSTLVLNNPVADFIQVYGYVARFDYFIFVSDKASRAPPLA
ncbi:MAG: hypothetical protein CVU09_16435 [Bacteroidetes bacterium HGW-Bacteroidetes-4]|jgi:hypothetical protein|nr:MAG: hypothetical protein CVU09_16435 [Bacteroidetes bacterium HGW-Bacteroidetes-4]